MTKTRAMVAAGLAVILSLMITPKAMAHGAPEPREIDARVVTDWTGPAGLSEYGGDGLGSGHDLLTIDVREAYDPDGRGPAVFFRITWQGGDASAATLREELSFTAGGEEHMFSIETSDGSSFVHDFDLLMGPFDVGDGHPKAVDAVVLYDTIGVAAGDTIADIVLRGFDGEEPADVMPGGFVVQGADVPADPLYDGGPASFTLEGPASLLEFDPAKATVDASAGSQKVSLALRNMAGAADQFASVDVEAPGGVEALLASRTANVPSASPERTVIVTVTATPGSNGTIVVRALSDLGGLATAEIDVVAPEAVAPPADSEANATEPAEADGRGSGGGSSPGFIIPLLLAALAAATLVRRRE